MKLNRDQIAAIVSAQVAEAYRQEQAENIFKNDQLREDYLKDKILSEDDADQNCIIIIDEVSDGRGGTMWELAISKDDEITNTYTYFDKEQAEHDAYLFVSMHPEYDDAEF